MTLAVPDSTPPAIDPPEARVVLLAHLGSPRTWSTRRRESPGWSTECFTSAWAGRCPPIRTATRWSSTRT